MAHSNISLRFWVTGRFFRFSLISLSAKKVLGSCMLNCDATDLPHSYFEPLYPKVFRGTPKVDLVSSVWPPAPSKVNISEGLSIISSVFQGFFFDKIDFPVKTVIFAYSVSYIFRKLLIWRFLWAIRKHFLSILQGVTFLHTVGRWCKLDLILRHRY